MRIVSGLNTSATALNAARFAAELAARQDGDVLFVHAIRPPRLAPRSARSESREAAAREEIAACFDALAEELRPTGVEPRLRVVVGAPAEALREVATAVGADLLVVGESRRGARGRALLGSVQTALTRDSDHPVVVVPAGHAPQAGGRVLLAHDVTSRSTAAAEAAGRLAAAIGGSVKVVYDPSAGRPAATGWSVYDTLRRATETIAATAGDDVDVVTHRAAGALAGVLRDEASRPSTGFVVVDGPRHRDRLPERLERPWVTSGRRRRPSAG